jgi:TatD DNase family protein
MHSYTGTIGGALECIELGLVISFAGMVTYKNADALREVAAAIPRDKILIETDSPYLSPEPVRKIRRNEPAHVVHTCRRLAEARGETMEELAKATTENARRLFGLGASR